MSFKSGFFSGMGQFGHGIRAIVNSILLSAVYIFGVGTTSLAAKATGKGFLETRVSKQKKTYWSELNLKKKDIEEYYRQF